MKKILFFTAVSILIVSFTISISFGTKIAGRDITMKTSFGNVIFSHDTHMQKAISCQACHPEPYVTSDKHKTVTMKEMETGLSCGLCHNGKPAVSVKGSCTSCHKK